MIPGAVSLVLRSTSVCRFLGADSWERDRNRDRVQLIATRAVIQLTTTRGHQRPQAGACAVTDPAPRRRQRFSLNTSLNSAKTFTKTHEETDLHAILPFHILSHNDSFEIQAERFNSGRQHSGMREP